MKSKTKMLPEHQSPKEGGTNKTTFKINNVMPYSTIGMLHWINYRHNPYK